MSTIKENYNKSKRKTKEKDMKRIGTTREKHLSWINVPYWFNYRSSEGKHITFDGDNNVYLLISEGDGDAIVYKTKKSNFYETTSKEGVCPNCEKKIRRYVDDNYLTCRICGWQYKTNFEKLKNLFK